MKAAALLLHLFTTWVTDNVTLTLALAVSIPLLLALLLRVLTREQGAVLDAAAEPAPLPGSETEEAVRVPDEIQHAEPLAAGPEPVAAPVPDVEPPAERIEPAPEPTPAAIPEPIPAPIPEPAREPEVAPQAPILEPEVPKPAPRISLAQRLARTSETLVGRIGAVLAGRKLDADLLEELEALLFTADLGVTTAESLLEAVRQQASGGDADEVRRVLHATILEKLRRIEPNGTPLAATGKPHVILVLGVNGSGKTTTIGKLAARYTGEGKSVILGAADTFRAAAIDQLQVWGERIGCEVIAGQPGDDPASVAFDTVKAAIARGVDVAIVDTAGRLQTKKPLMEELAKIVRVLSRDLPDAPHECLLVLDSNTGQNALSQTRLFTEVTKVTGLVLTKLDGSAKGGVIVGLADEFGIPLKYVGVGEGVEDLRDFEAGEFVDALFDVGTSA